MSYILGILGKSQRRDITVRPPTSVAVPTTYDGWVNSFGTSVVSYWKFQGTGTDEKGVVNATINGSPETGVATIVDLDTVAEGAPFDGTCIAWTGISSEYATVAHNSAHKTSNGTIIITFQCDQLNQKSTLLDADVGGVAGGVGMEVNTNGSIRAFLRNTSNVPIVLTGVAGDVQLNRAYTMILKWGSGLSLALWDDGGNLIRRLADAMTDGLTGGTSTLTFGVYLPTTSASHDGPFGRVIWLNRRITDVEEENLARARTIDHAEVVPPPQVGEMSVPSLAEWLKSDASNPTPTKYVSNQNRGNGSGSSAANAQEVQAALNGASAGQTFLAVCQTPGTIEFWNYPSGLTFPSGTSSNRITLQARNGDGVVISRGEDFAGARTPGSGFWTQSGLSADDISKKIWRSVSTFSGGEETMMGWWIEFDHPHQIIRASSMTNLRAAYNTDNSPTGYCGPGVHKDTDGRVYIRFQKPHPTKYSTDNKWSVQTWPGHPEAVSGGKLVYPISEDPNDYEIYLARVATSTWGFNGGEWLKIGPGINSMGHRICVKGNNIWMDRGLHYDWLSLVASSSGDTRTNFFFNRVRATDGSKLHLSRDEWKFGGWLEGIRSACMRASDQDTMNNIYCKDCTFADYHEYFVGNSGVRQFRYRNCTFIGIYDDGMQCQHNCNRIEIGYCYFFNCAYGGLGTTGSEGDAPNPGNWFLHHNIMDHRQERGSNWRAQPHPGFIYSDHSPDGRNPFKTYNNLIIFGPDTEEGKGPMLEHVGGNDNTLTGAALMHEVFNNILLRVFLEGSKRYDAISSLGVAYSDNVQVRTDYVNGQRAAASISFSASFANELFDYNLYWRASGLNVDGLLKQYARGKGQAKLNFATLAAWKAHSEFEHSKLSGTYRPAYSPGFDGNSTESKPTLPSIDNYPTDRFKYRPAATTAVTTAKTGSLSGANWWTTPPTWGATYFPWNDGAITLQPNPWKGPLDPSGTTLPVGVQNP